MESSPSMGGATTFIALFLQIYSVRDESTMCQSKKTYLSPCQREKIPL